jgi:hypothetical protein
MNVNHRIAFGFSENDSLSLDTIKKMFKTRIMASDISLLTLSEHGLFNLKSISKNFGHSVLDKVFGKSVESSNENENKECIELSIYGFKALTHKSFLETIEKKLLVKRKSKDYINFELLVPTIRIPYVKNKTFPSLKIQATSSGTELKLKLIGESSFIFILFYLKKCLEIYIKELPGALSECFSYGDGPATLTDSNDTDSTDSPPKAKKTYTRIIYDSSSDESHKETVKQVHGESGSMCLDGLSVKEKKSENETSIPSSVQTLPESGSPVYVTYDIGGKWLYAEGAELYAGGAQLYLASLE